MLNNNNDIESWIGVCARVGQLEKRYLSVILSDLIAIQNTQIPCLLLLSPYLFLPTDTQAVLPRSQATATLSQPQPQLYTIYSTVLILKVRTPKNNNEHIDSIVGN